ncbi:hypothetical protein [Micromonospora sagamiensis]|uniref:hypothetical protein n=1 Tax=Micromonospora sagamiensis TaxID=47875 RepID=UPI001E308B6B|nr:hypothetical protein [Micromonospora sagamiensis]
MQAQIALLDDTRLIDLLRAGHAAGFDMFTIDADAGLRPAIERCRARRSCRAPQAGACHQARPAQGPSYTSSSGVDQW